MRPKIEALLAELNRLKRSGVTHVSVTDESIRMLRKAMERGGAVSGETKGTPSVTQAAGSSVQYPDNHVLTKDASATLKQIFSDARDRVRTGSIGGDGKVASDATASTSSGPQTPVIVLPEGDKETRWEALRRMVLEDEECRAHTPPGRNVVFGVGNLNADIFFCGEAPGAEEETQGIPFVGPAGQLLTKIIGGMELSRDSVYIGNIMNWRPETEAGYGNRPPNRAEMEYCFPYLKAQIEVVNPKVIVALGTTAARGFLGDDSFKALGEVRGRWHEFAGRPLRVTYHPSYLLRNATNRKKRMVWEDMLEVMEQIGLPINDKQRGYYL